ncbi:uncharacterized protein PV06_02638 [Exophiala oligosperma]|uniref:Uncharacterized protein n=1 Tax=Exophiala oligosperma TaxID=215243 RepID=A0A0D2DWP4_9EURO|nr:uncharacterized protein PV06_02638 [Exophiala oligosperma]KIW47025.1 hypothetical protein PV06_02638 [Exophiala oligosperma]
MVLNPTSPVRVFGRKVANPSRPVGAEADTRTAPPPTTQLPHSAAPSPKMASSLREGMSRLRHLSRDRDATPQEVSRWSKTTTESEASEGVVKDQPPQPRNVLKKKAKQKRKSKDTTNSSPVDPSYDPATKRFLTEGELDVLPINVSGPIEPNSFYDSDDSGQESPVIERASSVRVAKPNIVQHNNNSGGSIPRLYAPHSTPTEVESGQGKDLQASSGRFLSTSAGGKEQYQPENPSGPEDALKALEGRDSNEDTLTALPQVVSFPYRPEQNDSVKETIIEFPDTPGRVEALSTLPTPMGGFGSVRLPPSGAGTTASSSGTFVSTTPSLDGLRSNPPTELDKKLSRAISAPVRNSRRVTIRPADLILTQTNNDHKLFRKNIVSTPYPARHSSIGEIDEIVAANAGGRKPSRESNSKSKGSTSSKLSRSLRRSRSTRKKSLSSTSPSTKVDLDSNTEKQPQHSFSDEPLAEKDKTAPEIPLSTKPVLGGASSTPAKSDRFPSPVAPEVLFLDLRLARHPSAKTTIEIEITDKTNFDDEQLFTLIQKSYRSRLLGVARRLFSARVLSYASFGTDLATISTATTPPRRNWYPGSPLPALTPGVGGGVGTHEIDGTDFVKHLHNPRLGRRRKMWLLWLRNNQQTESFASSRRNRARHAGGVDHNNNNSPSDVVSPVFSFMGHSRNSSHDSTDPYGVTGAQRSPLTASSATGGLTFDSSGGATVDVNDGAAGFSSAKPSVKIPRMPFQQPPPPTFPMSYRSLSRSHYLRGVGSGVGGSRESSTGASGPPCLHLHYTFSLPRIVAVLAAVLFLAVFTSVMWVLFGLPGRGADQGNTTTLVEGQEYVVGWKRDAQTRAGVAVVMGIAVLLGGVVCEAVWVWGSWVLI